MVKCSLFRQEWEVRQVEMGPLGWGKTLALRTVDWNREAALVGGVLDWPGLRIP